MSESENNIQIVVEGKFNFRDENMTIAIGQFKTESGYAEPRPYQKGFSKKHGAYYKGINLSLSEIRTLQKDTTFWGKWTAAQDAYQAPAKKEEVKKAAVKQDDARISAIENALAEQQKMSMQILELLTAKQSVI